MNNEVRNAYGKVIGFRCDTCGKGGRAGHENLGLRL